MSSERLASWAPPPKSRLRVWIAAGLLGAYVVFVLVVTITPNPVDQGFESSITRVLEILHRYGVPTWFGYHKLEFSANVGMFVPIGFLLGLAVPHRAWWLAVLAPVVFSALIEVTQLALLPGRFATFSDVLANSIGGWIGVLAAFALRGVVHARDRRVIAHALWKQGH